MVGGHSDSVLERRSEAAKLGLDNLRYEGFVPNDILPMYQAACEALLMPYQRRVSFTGGKGDTSGVMSPMKMFEYMAMGRLIITSNLPVIREVLNEDNAAVCEPDDIVAWYQSLRRGMTDPTWATRLAQQARLDARKYTWRRKVRAIFAALLGTGGRGTDS
jgi:glycosyltransferase involved in cell wall biosynthesis